MQAVMETASALENLDDDSVQSSSQYTEQSKSLHGPKANSLAMALGLKVDPSSIAPAIRERSIGKRVNSLSHGNKSFIQVVMEEASVAETLDVVLMHRVPNIQNLDSQEGISRDPLVRNTTVG
jgi:hypothetical protein